MPLIPEFWREDVEVTVTGRYSDITELSDGRILVTWRSDTNQDVYGEIYDQLGNLVVNSFPLNTFWNSGLQSSPRIAATPDGGWLVIYEDVLATGGVGIRLEAYNSSGTRVDNSSVAAITSEIFDSADIAVSSATSALITYEELNGSADSDYEFRIYNPDTETLGGEVNISFSGNYLHDPSNATPSLVVDTLANGDYVIAANTRTELSGDEIGLKNRDTWVEFTIISPTGTFVKLPTIVSFADETIFTGDQTSLFHIDVAALDGGGFVISWIDSNHTTSGVKTVKVQEYSSSGSLVGTVYTIEAGTGANSESSTQITALDDGGYIVSWLFSGNRSAQRFDSDGNTVGAQFASEDSLVATLLSDGRFVTFNESGLDFHDLRDSESQNSASGDWIGTIGTDLINGTTGDYYGWDGDDILIQRNGAGDLYGGEGNDELRHDGQVINGAPTTLDGGNGTDELWLADVDNWQVNLAAGTITVNSINFDIVTNVEDVLGGSGDNVITGDNNVNFLRGGLGNDTVSGAGGDDTVEGGSGNDDLFGGSGDDTLNGSFGNDRLDGNTGSDTLNGGDGNDELYQAAEGSTVNNFDGGNGTDTWHVGVLNGGYSGSDWMINLTTGISQAFQSGNPTTIVNTTSIENITSGNGDDNITGDGANNVIDAQSGADQIFGGAGDDVINGGAGNDSLYDGNGSDILNGESGNDILAVAAENANVTDTVDGGGDTDELVLASGFSSGWNVFLNGGTEVANFINNGNTHTVNFSSIETLETSSQADAITGSPSAVIVAVNTLGGNDIISIWNNLNALDTGSGNDTITFDNGAVGIALNAIFDGGDNTDTAVFVNFDMAQSDIISLGAPDSNVAGTSFSLLQFEAYDGTGNASTSSETVIGSNFDNVISTGAGDNIINGSSGNDTINAGGGEDIVQGGSGTDIVNLDAGNDTLLFQSVNNDLNGPGNIANGGSGTDTIEVRGFSLPILDNFVFDLSAGTLTIDGILHSTLQSFENYNSSTLGNDGSETVLGTNGANIISTGGGDNIIDGRSGADIINAGAGNDWVSGGFSSDQLDGGAGIDTVDYTYSSSDLTVDLVNELAYGTAAGPGGETVTNFENVNMGSGDDIVLGDSSANTINGGVGSDDLNGGGGDDDLYGGSGNDTLNGSSGDDRLDGDTGSDDLNGGDGNDELWQNAEGATTNNFDGGAGTDTWHLGSLGGGYSGSDWTINLGTGFSQAIQGGVLTTIVNTISVENIVSGSGDDTITGDSGANTINAGSGNDIIDGAAGGDIINAGAGDDWVSGGFADDQMNGGAGIDTVDYTYSGFDLTVDLVSELAYGTAAGPGGEFVSNFENVNMGSGDDIVIGNDLNNILSGGGGIDILTGGLGADTLDGGGGFDTASYAGASEGVTASLFTSMGTGGEATGDTYTDIEALIGSDHNDVLVGRDGASDTIHGGDGFDGIRGNGGDDFLYGEGGDDFLFSGFGADFHDGGTGIDTILYNQAGAGVIVNLTSGTGAVGQAEGDTYVNVENVVGTAFADLIVGSAGNNSLQGRAGNDILDGRGGADALNGGNNFDTVTYASSNAAVVASLFTGVGFGGHAAGDSYIDIEALIGSDFDDLLIGRDLADDTLTGGDGSDGLRGNGGDDILLGEGGDDLLFSGFGADHHDGGDGVDILLFDTAGAGVIVNLTSGTGALGQAEGDTYVNIENVVGTAFGDLVVGSATANRLEGRAGNDVLDGRGGADVLVGGNNADRFVFEAGYGTDRIEDFTDSDGDVIDVRSYGFVDFAAVQALMFTSGADVVINFGGGDALRLVGVDINDLDASDFLLSGGTAKSEEFVASDDLETGTEYLYDASVLQQDLIAEFLATASNSSPFVYTNDAGMLEIMTEDDIGYHQGFDLCA